MTSGPLVPHAKVRQWEDELHTALGIALAAQRRAVFKAIGVRPTKALTAATSNQRKAVVSVGVIAWSVNNWAKLIDTHVTPVTTRVAGAALLEAKAAIPASHTMGMPESSVSTANHMTDLANSAGNDIGGRVNTAVQRAADLTAAADDAEEVLGTADAILDNVVGSMAAGAASSATTDVTSYLAGYFGNIYEGATKTWNSVGDDRVRPDHDEADGDEVALNDVFIVGGETMVGPHDPSASDDQTIGCRCWLSTDGVLPEGTTDDEE